jgi:hypothetical protein
MEFFEGFDKIWTTKSQEKESSLDTEVVNALQTTASTSPRKF